MSNPLYNGYTLVALRSFDLTNWTGKVSFDANPVLNFDSVKVLTLNWTTPTTGNNTMEFQITSHPSWNVGIAVANGTSSASTKYLYRAILDSRADANLNFESINPIINLSETVPLLNNFDYECTINKVKGDPDISVSSPVYIEIGFFKRI